jgi:hypothetical protein
LRANDVESLNDSIPSTGQQIYEDTIVNVPISIIRKANDKMIERKYLLKVNSAQDSIIQLNNNYIIQQDSIIIDLKDRILRTNKINEELQKQYEKERKKKIVYGSVAGALAVGIVTSIVTAIYINK